MGDEVLEEQVAVLGGGLMGSGIAEVAARSGFDVVVREVDATAADAARERVEHSLTRALRAGKLDEEQVDAARSRLRYTSDLHDVAGAGLVIEAVSEQLSVKARLLSDVADIVGPAALIASNTSSIPIAQLAANVRHPERVLGLHFFSPVPVMRLVEIVRALATDDAAVDRAKAFALRLGKEPVETKDRSGFIVNMLLVPYLMAAIRMYEEGFATAEDIDSGMQLGCGHPMGPLALSDFIGLDVLYSIGESLYDEFKRAEYAPPPLLKRMVASGYLGRKARRGFFSYEAAS